MQVPCYWQVWRGSWNAGVTTLVCLQTAEPDAFLQTQSIVAHKGQTEQNMPVKSEKHLRKQQNAYPAHWVESQLTWGWISLQLSQSWKGLLLFPFAPDISLWTQIPTEFQPNKRTFLAKTNDACLRPFCLWTLRMGRKICSCLLCLCWQSFLKPRVAPWKTWNITWHFQLFSYFGI